jgi:hypothetical protein
VQLRPPGQVGLPEPGKSLTGPQNLALPPQEASTRRHFPAAGVAGATASLIGDSDVATPPVLPWVVPFPAARAQAAILPLAPIKAPPEAPELAAPTQVRRVATRAWMHYSAPTLPKPTLPSLSPPHTEAVRLIPAPSSSPERRHHHSHPLPALCHHWQAASVHPFPTQGHKQVWFVPLLLLAPSPLAVGDPCRRNLAGRRRSPAQRTLLL